MTIILDAPTGHLAWVDEDGVDVLVQLFHLARPIGETRHEWRRVRNWGDLPPELRAIPVAS